MKVFLAGGSGALGRRLVPQLVHGGYEVSAMTRTAGKAQALRALGAQPVVADALDRGAVMQALMRAEPEVVIHQLTSLAGIRNLRNFDKAFALTNRLRTEGTDHLLAGAQAAGARRFIAQSFCGWPYERTGSRIKDEQAPFDPQVPATQRQTLDAIRHLESHVLAAEGLEGIVLRYGAFYGPGSDLSESGSMAELVRKRRLPIIGDGAGISSLVHLDDAASATVAAIEHGAAGVYNIVDDEPAPAAEWLTELARVLGAKSPRRVPLWLGRLAAGEAVVAMMTDVRGGSNAKAKRELAWGPHYRTYREGFRRGLDDVSARRAGTARETESAE